jgi:hypothetical protein
MTATEEVCPKDFFVFGEEQNASESPPAPGANNKFLPKDFPLKLFKHSSYAFTLLAVVAIAGAAFGGSNVASAQSASGSNSGINVTSPGNGAYVGSPFNIQASATTCAGQAVTAVGFSLDTGSTTVSLNGTTQLNSQAAATAGQHALYVKSWGSAGATCYTQVNVVVTNSNSASTEIVPQNAVSVSNIQNTGSWQLNHDPATGSASSGSMAIVPNPSITGNARQFNTSFSNYGGEIYNVAWGNDPNPSNFFYDGWVYMTSSASNILNLEMDMNQVLPNGDTVIYGFQCDGASQTWDYTKNAGTPAQPNDQWVHSNAYCNASQWTPNMWHHVQISYSRDNSGNVTYHSVWLDGLESPLNVTVPSDFTLGWTPTLLTNFQVDGNQSGSNTVYLDNLTISRW